MSDSDSFIEEVTEEVRRDRLFGYIRKYAWVAVSVVVLIVGGAAYNEYSKAQQRARAQATGDAIYSAVEQNENAARIASLAALDPEAKEATLVIDFLLASHQVVEGQHADAAVTLDRVANASDQDIPEIYRQIALFKSVAARGSEMAMADRRSTLEAMAAPGAPLALLAQEQLALADIEESKTDEAIARLSVIIVDSGVTPGLLRRATQLIVALGGELPAIQAGQAGSE
ncbi:hypothetical protein SAMN05444000_103136 [Shimia gijangensis]|uniref:Tetratricopeptide repeat-like domain-containing protein n=1 Tax=Shimia gijangensis TaxID=1470563 RepID=A0A1M6E7X1_9RHOB|nr:hypothetical protein [Shimia gijangensis]SHI81541.1 hypothetical protein SAMN05444000_103136 [Shimia gijangensis]